MTPSPSAGAATNEHGVLDRLRKGRRRYVKKFGKRFIRSLADFIGRESTVGDPPVFDAAQFSFVREIEAEWPKILAELQPILEKREHLPSFHEISPDQSKISRGNNWKTFVLLGFGYKSERNCRQCPETIRLLSKVPNLRNALFSILAPGYHIPEHRGVTKGLIRVHLALVVPKERDKCVIRIEGQDCPWEPGTCLVFDDTYRHEVLNDTDEERVVLLFDFDRPMRWRGRLLNKFFLWAIHWTAYVQDGRKNMPAWEDRFEAAA